MSENDVAALRQWLTYLVTEDGEESMAGAMLARFDAVEAVVKAVEAAGPWPRIDSVLIQPSDQTTFPLCRDCHRTMNLPHADDCPGIALRNALAALTTGGGE